MEKKKTGKLGVGSWCKKCKSKDRLRYARAKRYRQINLEYYYRNKIKWKYLKAKRRAALINASIYGYEDQLKVIYENCPPGYEVDHIIPLQNKNVCGLHVPWNLQYLTVRDNRVKSNKL